MTWPEVEMRSFLTERKDRFKPAKANALGLKRLEKIDFGGKLHISESKPTKTNMIMIKKGDLVISGINAEKGALGIYDGNEDILATIHYSSYHYDKTKININYLRWFLKSSSFKRLLIEQAGAGIKTEIKPRKLLPLKFNLPDLKTQEKIAKLIALCEDLEEKLNQVKTDSERLTLSMVEKVRSTTPYKNDAAVVCFLLAQMEKLNRPTTEFFIQKHIFAAKHHLQLPVNSLFVRKVAGPWSHELKRKAIFAAIKMNWLRWEKIRLVAGSAFEKGLSHAAMVLGESTDQLAQLVENLKTFGQKGLERWTTVLKVVEDLKEKQQPITRANIQHEIDNWRDKRLKKIFAEESVDYTIDKMIKYKWLPTTAGQ
ncbi:MAG: hypothetical protein ABIL62_15535 [Planctomycetota bacterium]